MQAMEEIVHAAHAMDRSPAVKALIITGEGPKYFAAGADIKEMADQTFQEVNTSPLISTAQSCMTIRPQLQQIPMIVTALLHCLAYQQSECMLTQSPVNPHMQEIYLHLCKPDDCSDIL